MDLLSLFVSINKLSLLAFIVVLGFLGYEIYSFKKESKKGAKPAVPRFTGDTSLQISNPKLVTEQTRSIEKKNMTIFIVLGVLLVVFGIITILGFVRVTSNAGSSSKAIPTPIVTFAASNGIKILDETFKPLPDEKIPSLVPGTVIMIGVETVPNTDIDRARIRVNSNAWNITDITTQFNKEFNIFYIPYTIATDTVKLDIQAQLHSAEDGWLGE